ncbi:MAG: hypothetical protein ACQET1_10495 [Gemmatimonadota bacterium]
MTKRRLPPALSFRLFSAIALMLSVMASETPVLAQEPVHWEVASRMRQAQSWIMGRMEEMGLARVHMEPWGEHTVGWDMERVSVHMLEPDYQMVIGYPLAFTPGTDGPFIGRAVIAVIETPDDLDRLRGRLRDAVVLATPPMPVTPRFAQDAFRHTEESLHAFETEGVDLLLHRHRRGQPTQGSFSSEVPEEEVEAFYRSEGVAAVLRASIGSDGTVQPPPP